MYKNIKFQINELQNDVRIILKILRYIKVIQKYILPIYNILTSKHIKVIIEVSIDEDSIVNKFINLFTPKYKNIEVTIIE